MKSPKFAQGFTLLELLVVIAIIGLLATYVGLRYFSQLSQSERGTAKMQIESLAKPPLRLLSPWAKPW